MPIEKRIILVLSGGLGLGAYHAGAYQRMEEDKLRPSRDARFKEFDPRMPLVPSPAGPAVVRGCCCVPPSGLVDVSVGCQRNRSGAGQISNGSSGRSAHRHQV